MILNDINIENNPIKSENLGILYKNLVLLLETDVRKLNQFLREITNDIQEKNIRKKEIIDKAENSLQEYDLLYFEINSLKQALIPQCEKINQKVLNNILKISNPNDSIFFLMKTFYWVTKGFEKDKNKEKNDIQWDFLQKNLSYKTVLLYLSFISNSTMSYLTNEDLDEAMPFLVNYDKLKNIFHDISEDLVIVLDFVKSSLELNVKLNIMNSLYENNCNKNTKIENIDKSINNLNNLYQNGKMILLQINKDYKNYKELNGSKEEQIKNGYLIMEKYALFERYSVEKERPTTIEDDVSAIKFIIKLNKKYRNKEKFLFHLFLSLNNFNKGKRKLDENKFISDIKNSNNKKIKKNKNFEKKCELNSIKEENYSSSLNTQNNIYNNFNNYSNNISDFDNLTGRYSYNYNYDWFINSDQEHIIDKFVKFNNYDDLDNIIPIGNSKYHSLVIKGNIEKNQNNKNSFPVSSLNILLKKENRSEKIKLHEKISESSSGKFTINKTSKDKLTLEKEENENYCSSLCLNYK